VADQVVGPLTIANTLARLKLYETDASADEGRWELRASAGRFYILAVSDDELSDTTVMSVARSGYSAGTVNFPTLGFTINGQLVWHAGNDGTGSGLDADTVDGIEGANLLRSDVADTVAGPLTIANTLTRFKLYETDASADEGRWELRASAGYFYILAVSDDELSNTTVMSVARSGYTTGTVNFPTLGLTINGQLVWHAGNDGTGSGLDGDTVDGYHADALGRFKSESTGTGSGVTLTASATTTIATANLGTVATGDRIWLEAVASWGVGASAGNMALYLGFSSGTATVSTVHGETPTQQHEFNASASVKLTLGSWFKVTAGGTLVMKAYAFNGTAANATSAAAKLAARVYSA